MTGGSGGPTPLLPPTLSRFPLGTKPKSPGLYAELRNNKYDYVHIIIIIKII